MNDDELNISIRKFLKMVGVGSQREIEQAVARRCRKVRSQEPRLFPRATLEIAGCACRRGSTARSGWSRRRRTVRACTAALSLLPLPGRGGSGQRRSMMHALPCWRRRRALASTAVLPAPLPLTSALSQRREGEEPQATALAPTAAARTLGRTPG